MGRILATGLSTSLAHAGRLVTLARALQERGHQVTLAGQPKYFESCLLADRAEFAFEVLFEPDLDEVLAGSRGRPSGIDGAAALAGAIVDELTLYGSVRPELVIVDNRRSAVISAEIAGIPSLSLTSSSLLGPLSAIDPTVDEVADICAPALGRDAEVTRRSLELQQGDAATRLPLQPVRLPPAFEDLFHHYRIPIRRMAHELAFGTRTLILDVDSLYPVHPLPGGAACVGPLLFEVAAQRPRWWDALGERPVVYATFGSTGEGDRFGLALEELAGLDAAVVASTAGLVDGAPRGVYAARYLPGGEITRRASLVVCHGGSLTMYQALAEGVPVLAIPTHLEQAIETIPMVRAGVARAFPKTALQVDGSALREVAAGMLAGSTERDAAQARAAVVDGGAALASAIEAAEALLAG